MWSTFLVLKALFLFILKLGYVGAGDSATEEEGQVFYYFIESENNPQEDPLMLWLTGGPGCSSFSGLIYEIGPITFKDKMYNDTLPNLVLRAQAWTKVKYIHADVDGSRDRNGHAACGGVIRDHQGNWMCGFQQRLGQNSSAAAEIHAIHSGLQLCKQLGFTKIRLFTDSLQAIHLLSIDGGTAHPLFDVLLETRSLIYRDWDLAITHAHRESIQCADYLARRAQLSNQDFLVIETRPVECDQLFAMDCGGILQDHSVMQTT